MNPAVRRAFGAAATVVNAIYTERKAAFVNEVTPLLLAEANLPAKCAAFFKEGLRPAEKNVYEPHVRDIMRNRLGKWTVKL